MKEKNSSLIVLRSSQEQTNPSHSQDENDVTMTEHDSHSTSIHQNQTTMSDNNGF